MAVELKNDYGTIQIADEIFSTLAGYATVENYGIVGMTSKSAGDGIRQLLGRDNLKRGVVINTEGGKVAVDLYILVQYGVSIKAVADNVIQNVGYNLKEKTGVDIDQLNVHVEGVRINSK